MIRADSQTLVPAFRSRGLRWLHRGLRLGARRDARLAAWLLLMVACSFLAYVARLHEITHDAFHEMSLVREALVLGEFPQQDLFAYTPTVSPSVHHEWGTGAVLYFATVGSGLGLLGLSLLKLTLMSVLWLCIYRVARLRGAHPYVFACLALLTFPVLWVGFATVRAQLFTLVFIAIQMWMQELDWRGRRAWIVWWLLMLVAWLNLHAGFVVGLGLIAFHAIERFAFSARRHHSFLAAVGDTWHLILAAPVAALSLQLNPYGWQYVAYLVRAIRMPRPLIAEWQPLWQTHAPVLTLAMFAASLSLFVYAQRFNRTRRLHGAAFLALCTYMAIKHIRHGSIFAVVWLAYVPAWISHTSLGKRLVQFIESDRQSTVRVCRWVAAGSMCFALLHHFWLPSLPPKQLYSPACYPTGAAMYLKSQDFRGNLLTPFYAGAYISWELYPQVKVSLDGRYEVAYQEHVMPEHKLFHEGQGEWWKLLDKYATDAALIDKQSNVCGPILRMIEAQKADPAARLTQQVWRIAYEDDAYLLIAGEHTQLPTVERLGEPLVDGAWSTFSSEHAHWRRSTLPDLTKSLLGQTAGH